MRRCLRALAGLVLLLAAAGCVGPSRTSADYREKAANAAEAMRSSVQTARLTVAANRGDKATARYTSLVLSEAEDDASSVATSFEVVQPPDLDASLDLRERVTSVFDEVTTVLGGLRIAARAGRHDELPRLAEPLPALARRLSVLMELAPT